MKKLFWNKPSTLPNFSLLIEVEYEGILGNNIIPYSKEDIWLFHEAEYFLPKVKRWRYVISMKQLLHLFK